VLELGPNPHLEPGNIDAQWLSRRGEFLVRASDGSAKPAIVPHRALCGPSARPLALHRKWRELLCRSPRRRPGSGASCCVAPLVVARAATLSHTALQPRPRARPRPMGSLGWVRCRWCWSWTYNPYLADPPAPTPLCEVCWVRCYEDWARPPWQPDALQRQANMLVLVFDVSRSPPNCAGPLPTNVIEHIAAFLVWDFLP